MPIRASMKRQRELELEVEHLKTSLAEAKEALTANQRLASFPQANPNPVLELDRQGTITFANPAAKTTLERLGYPTDGRAFVPPDMANILKKNGAGEQERFYREVTLGDTVFAEDIFLMSQTDSIHIYTRDITGRKQAEDELAGQLDEPNRWKKEKTLQYLRANSGLHFDPRVVVAFLVMLGEMKEVGVRIRDQEMVEGSSAMVTQHL